MKGIRAKRSNWIKWSIFIVCLMLVACAIYSIYLYQGIQQQKTAGLNKSKEKILNETELTQIEDMYKFHGEKSYHIFFGKTKNNEKEIAFLPLDKDENNITIIDQTKIISKKAIQHEWHEQCDTCKLIKITPAMVQKKPLWEITYKDENNRHVLDYLSIYDGTRYEQYRFKQMLK